MDFVENNRLLDVFMESPGEYVSHNGMYEGRVLSTYQPHLYHLDWNLLMDVVFKIESLGYIVTIGYRTAAIHHEDDCNFDTIHRISENSKRESVYAAVLGFVKWYNTKEI